MSYKIAGVTGTLASGKDSLAVYLEDRYHFKHYSTADILREESMRLRGSIERPVLYEVADQLRHTQGGDVLVKMALERFEAQKGKYEGLVISAMRSLAEVEAIKKAGGMIVWVDAPIELRYQRMVGRERDNETRLNLEGFRANEEKELHTGSDNPAAFNLTKIRDMADIHLANDTDLDTFLAKAVKALDLGDT